ncbi:glycerol-3-phosphate 1-O-acyltransferase PlsY [uncultured Desulfuromonas sp.]|uniref:glycerol-3-phosphate 1-O-acyltransferase PlsY n=1 Tax=uncultured Desulfuromonas sp. TaxID=181013 RepID=UPI002AAB9C97|nr:glycerol-3-phosphate 1-O-acyltransferase PlsY [uncultured Desulfuromonas sp.]
MMELTVILLVSYLIGAIPSGVVLTRLSGATDVRKAGSGNIGATNVYRVAGKRLGILTLLADMLKGVMPLLAVQWLYSADPKVLAWVAVALFVGHCYPIYLMFKGGKGVATALGIYLVLSPASVGIALLVFAFVLWRWRYVSLASISAAAVIPALVYGFERSLPIFIATLVIAAGVIYRHRSNIARLLDGSENRFKG